MALLLGAGLGRGIEVHQWALWREIKTREIGEVVLVDREGLGEGVVEVGASEERMERMRHASRNANATRFGLSGFILWQSIIVLQLQSA